MIIDLVLAVLLILAIVKGLQRGLIVSVFSVIGLVVGLVAAMKLSAVTASYLKGTVNVSAQWLPVIAFAVVFLVAVLLVRLGAKALEKTVQVAMLGWVNRLGGVALFIFLYTLIFSVALFYASKINFISAEAIQASKTYSYIQPLGPWAIDSIGAIIPLFKNLFKELEAFFISLSNKVPSPRANPVQ
jgi:membrane protein required for colicin V production